jgi:3-oxoacyl-(acyl-carrier-protein) synthase
MAALLLKSGAASLAIAGGVDSADPHFFAGFDSMGAYNREDNDNPERASRPYAADRKGFIFGEGAGIVVLELRSAAEARGANVLAVLHGFGMSSDGTGQMVQPAMEGGLRAMRAALDSAGLEPVKVEYVNTHATSTPLGDVSEVRALKELLGGRHVPYSSTKGYTGHTVSGAGAIEAIFTVEMLTKRFLAPCIHAEPLDSELSDYAPVLNETERSVDLALSNSFGFGGTNVTLVLGRA